MLKNRFPSYYIAISALLGAGICYLVLKNPINVPETYASAATTNKTDASINCDFNVGRMNGYKHIKPLLFAEKQCESPSLDGIKQNIINLVETAKASGKVVSASVYLRVYSKGDWTSYNVDERFHPASLSKVPILITYMRMAEKNPGLMDKKIFFDKPDATLPPQYYRSETLKPGHNYSVKELLRYMIAYSDNDATTLLWKQMNFDDYNTTFTDLGLAKPSYKFEELQLSAKEYATFFNALYNASYLSNQTSEFCFSLLIQSDFKDGLLKKLPANITVAHKFGECNYAVVHAPGEKPYGNLNELHEAGIIYSDNTPYLISVMTKGADRKSLSDLVGDISSLVYTSLSNKSQTGIQANSK